LAFGVRRSGFGVPGSEFEVWSSGLEFKSSPAKPKTKLSRRSDKQRLAVLLSEPGTPNPELRTPNPER
jgi:hypothetical protein